MILTKRTVLIGFLKLSNRPQRLDRNEDREAASYAEPPSLAALRNYWRIGSAAGAEALASRPPVMNVEKPPSTQTRQTRQRIARGC